MEDPAFLLRSHFENQHAIDRYKKSLLLRALDSGSSDSDYLNDDDQSSVTSSFIAETANRMEAELKEASTSKQPSLILSSNQDDLSGLGITYEGSNEQVKAKGRPLLSKLGKLLLNPKKPSTKSTRADSTLLTNSALLPPQNYSRKTQTNYEIFDELWCQFICLHRNLLHQEALHAYEQLESMSEKKELFTTEEKNLIAFKLARIQSKASQIEFLCENMKESLKLMNIPHGWESVKMSQNFSVSMREGKSKSSVAMKLETMISEDPTKIMNILKKFENWGEWVPQLDTCIQVSSSEFNTTGLYLKFGLPAPFSDRDGFFIVSETDRRKKDGSYFLQVLPIHDNQEQAANAGIELTCPYRAKRVTLNTLAFEVLPLAPKKCRLRAICDFDPQINLFSKGASKKFAMSLFENLFAQASGSKI